MCGFEKINYQPFVIDISDNEKLYNEYNVPKRSGMEFKYNVRMCNQAGSVDSIYYNNSINVNHI